MKHKGYNKMNGGYSNGDEEASCVGHGTYAVPDGGGAMAANSVQVTTGTVVEQYANLDAAFSSTQFKNATGDVEVKLLENSTLSYRDNYAISLADQNVTILLNGKKMTLDANGTYNYAMARGNLLIKGKGELSMPNNPFGFAVYPGVKFLMEDVTCSTGSSTYVFLSADPGNVGASVEFAGGSYNIKGAIIVQEKTESKVSADLYDSLINRFDYPDNVEKVTPKVEITPSRAPVSAPVDLPQTGDNSHLLFFAALLATSAAGLMVVRRKNEN